MKKLAYVLLILGISLCVSCKENASPSSDEEIKPLVLHYRHIGAHPLWQGKPHQIEAFMPLTAEDATNEAHYRLTFNTDSLLQAVEFMKGNSLANGSTFKAARLVITRNGDTTWHAYYNASGKPVRNQKGAYGEAWIYSKEQVLTQLYLDSLKHSIALESGTAKIEYMLDSEGRVTKQHPYNQSGASTGNARIFEYYPNGRLKAWIFVDTDGNTVNDRTGKASATFTWNDNGQPLEWSYFNKEGDLMDFRGESRTVAAYNTLGRLVTLSYYTSEGKPRSKRPFQMHVAYTPTGSREEVRLTNSQGKLANDATLGYAARLVYTYDDREQLIAFNCYNANGALTGYAADGHRAATINYHYNANGQLVKTEKLDKAGETLILLEGP